MTELVGIAQSQAQLLGPAGEVCDALERNLTAANIPHLRNADWEPAAAQLLEQHGRRDVDGVLAFVRASAFWAGKVRSMTYLREKWAELTHQARRDGYLPALAARANGNGTLSPEERVDAFRRRVVPATLQWCADDGWTQEEAHEVANGLVTEYRQRLLREQR